MTELLETLLAVQEKDLGAEQLRHRRASLPERVALADEQAAVTRIDAEAASLGEQVSELQRSQKRFEDEIATIEAKADAESKRMYSGSVTSPRELQAMQEEIDGLTRRQRHLEDELLDVLEALEPLTAQVDDLAQRRAAAVSAADDIASALAAAEASVDGELAAIEAERAALAAGVPAELLATYERLRGRLDGVGVARLEGAQCAGCHLSLPAAELDAVRHAAPGSVLFHEECGRILVP